MSMTAIQKLACRGGAPLRTRPWPTWPVWDEEDAQAVANVVRSGVWFAGSGTECRDFSAEWAALHDARYAVPCANGTVALEIALRAAGVKAGDEVITTPYTFIATAAACVQINAVPIFADIDGATFNLDPAAAEAAVTERTRAIIAVHIAGNPADMDALSDLARRKDLVIVEDAAQAHLAEWRERKVGAIGQAGTFSFQASKNLNAGEGGVVITDSEETYEQAWSLVNCGRVREGGWYEHRMLSGNYRLTEFQAALLRSQARRLPEQTRLRNENALYLAGALAEIEGVTPLTRDPRVTQHTYHKFIFRYRSEAFGGLSRPDFLAALQAEGIPCHPGYDPMYRSPAFKINTATHPFASRVDYSRIRLPEVEQACSEAIWLDQRMLLAGQQDMDDITAAILKIQQATRS
ncbi:MAG: putative pyridoxal phosphate-dependent enzyme apparently involved in regulation of cell wall [Armatimonadetes bacterium]|nr:putative pyridoxal phosphate-dependent enzyme apparently involved in regulation of cell wall [Armatimonadota bacterium]